MKRMRVEVSTAALLAFFLLTLLAIIGYLCYTQKYSSNSTGLLQHSISAYAPLLVLAVVNFRSKKYANINRRAKNNAKIAIFQGRGAVRNLAIFRILVTVGPLSMGDIQRKLNKIRGLEVTYYASLNKRIHALLQGGYIGEVKPAVGQAAGFRGCRYEVRTKFYLAYYLNGKSRDDILKILNDEPNAITILSELINADNAEA